MINSGILKWSLENIEQSPAAEGVFVLITSPINGSAQKIGQATNLKEMLGSLYKEEIYPETKFFEWFMADNQDESLQKFTELKSQYNI